jgi:hypothetical protein
MSDHAPVPESGPAGPPATSLGSRLWAGLSPGERLVVVGAALILFIDEWLLSALLGGQGSFISTPIAAGELLLLVAIRHGQRPMTWPIPYAVVLALLATVIAVPAISGFLDTLRHIGDIGSLGAINLLGLLVEWAGAVLLAWGAYRVWAAGEPV